jgi:hypothetical protein
LEELTVDGEVSGLGLSLGRADYKKAFFLLSINSHVHRLHNTDWFRRQDNGTLAMETAIYEGFSPFLVAHGLLRHN